jgi:hypothetical protein
MSTLARKDVVDFNPFTSPMTYGHGVNGGPTDAITYEDIVAMAVPGESGEYCWPYRFDDVAEWLTRNRIDCDAQAAARLCSSQDLLK